MNKISVASCNLLLAEVRAGNPILVAQDLHPDLPTIHNFAGKYHKTVEHMGYGFFAGNTENGQFTFDAGGAMRRLDTNLDPMVYGTSWTPLNAEPAVMAELGYDFKKVEQALIDLLAKAEGEGK